MAFGIEAMAKAAIENYLEEHPELLVQAKQIGQFVLTVDARLQRIEHSQRLIMDALKIGVSENAERTGPSPGEPARVGS